MSKANRIMQGCGVALVVFMLLVVGLIAGCLARWPAKATGERKTFITPDGQSMTITEWERERVLKFPFFDGNSAYIQFDDNWVKIHDGEFGAAFGGFFVSPQRDVVIVIRAFEGGSSEGILIDLRTGKHRPWNLFSKDPDVTGWSREGWSTGLEATPREQLHKQLASSNSEIVELAKSELGARGFVDADWLAMARVVADKDAPLPTRRYLAFSMVSTRQRREDARRRAAHFGTTTMPATSRPADFDYAWPPKMHWPEELIRLYESALDDPDPELRKLVREALDDMRAAQKDGPEIQ